MESALFFPVGRPKRDFQRELLCVISVCDAEDSAVGAVGEELLDVKIVADFSTH